jgi:hypothetical protein
MLRDAAARECERDDRGSGDCALDGARAAGHGDAVCERRGGEGPSPSHESCAGGSAASRDDAAGGTSFSCSPSSSSCYSSRPLAADDERSTSLEGIGHTGAGSLSSSEPTGELLVEFTAPALSRFGKLVSSHRCGDASRSSASRVALRVAGREADADADGDASRLELAERGAPRTEEDVDAARLAVAVSTGCSGAGGAAESPKRICRIDDMMRDILGRCSFFFPVVTRLLRLPKKVTVSVLYCLKPANCNPRGKAKKAFVNHPCSRFCVSGRRKRSNKVQKL